MKAKILLQHVWTISNQTKKYGWDDELPAEVIEKWMKIKSRSIELNSTSVTRWVNTSKNTRLQIHGYCDASEKAYAACVYIRATNGNVITSTLLVAKSKNAPPQTIPKLELCGAKLLTQLTKKVQKTLQVNIEQVHQWCESKCVLGWIAANPQRYKKYVSSRISYIQKLKNVEGHHISGKQNPADCASRGLFGNELKNNNLWWNGPPNPCEHINYDQISSDEYTTENELKTNKINALVSNQVKSFLPRSSTFYKLKKTMSYVLRFVNNCRKNRKEKGQVSVREMRYASIMIVKIIQNESFSDEKKCLKNKQNINKKSKLIKLNVFIDDEEMIRVGGRLKNSNIPFDAKHQIILPKNNEVTNLIITEAHKLALHGGPKVVESVLRQKYWIIDSQSTIKKEIKNCVLCAKYRAR